MKKLFVLLIVVVLSLTLVSCTDEIMSMLPEGITSMIPGANTGKSNCKNHVDNDNDGVCDKEGCGASVDKSMEDMISFDDEKFTYDGTPKSIEVTGAPDGATVTYEVLDAPEGATFTEGSENTHINAGTYDIKATVSAEGYEDYEIEATLTISKRTLTVIWPDSVGPFHMSGEKPVLDYDVEGGIEGEDLKIKYDFGGCDFTVEDMFTLTVTTANPNYKMKTTNGANKINFRVEEIICVITYIDNSLQFKDPKPASVDYGGTLVTPEPIKSGYEFVGWFDENDTMLKPDDKITRDMTLTAKWKLLDYELIYHTNGGVNHPSNPTTCTIETGINAAAPTREGRIFLGWYTDNACTQPLSSQSIDPKTPKTIHLYAKWSTVDYTSLITGDSLNSEFVLQEYLGDGAFRYTFSANVKNFGEDSVIRIGRGKNTRDGGYIEITSTSITVYNNNGEVASKEDKTHGLVIKDFIVIDIIVKTGADIYLRTSTGSTDVFRDFVCKIGEVFVTSENAELERCEFGWNTDAYNEPVWILGDSSLKLQDATSWINKFRTTGYSDLLLMSAYEQDSTSVLAAFEDALAISVPKYALWSFPFESGEAYDANLQAFIALCKAKGITPILTTELVAVNPDNAAKNAAVIASGERYVDFAYLENYSGVLYEDGAYTVLGTDSMHSQLLADFPEIITPNTTITSVFAPVIDSDDKTTEIGDTLNIANVKLKDGKVVVFTAKINGSLDEDGELIRIGHGYGGGYSGWLEITPTKILDYRAGAHGDPAVRSNTHGITIKNFITIIWQQDERLGKRVTVVTDGGSYYGSWSSQPCNNWIAVSVEGGVELTDAKGHYTGLDYDAPIWAFGASYFSLNDPARWPSYLYSDRYDENVLVIGVGGLGSVGGIEQLKDALQHGTPKAIVWGYGINDGADPEGGINAKTYAGHIEFLSICQEKGIIPVFFSTPCLPANKESGKIPNHEGKMEYVLDRLGEFANYDYRVASLPHAVNAYENGATWYPGMMSGDTVHPTALGARNMFMELVCALPELMIGEDAVLMQSPKMEELYSGSELTINTPEFVEKEFGLTFIADYTGLYDGKLIIGNGKDVEGGSWVEITADTVKVFTRKASAPVEVASSVNDILLEEIVMVKIHVVDGVATISIVGSGDKENRVTERLFTITATWGYAGDAFAVSESTRLKDAQLSFVYEE